MTEEALDLKPLPPEPWGDGIRRAREACDLTLRQVEAVTGGELTASTVGDIERRLTPPTRSSQRRRAAQAMVLYGFAPSEIGLTLEDVGLADVTRLRRLREEWVARDSNPEPAGSLPERRAA